MPDSSNQLTPFNHLTIDDRIKPFSPQGIHIGIANPFPVQAYVNLFLDFWLHPKVPPEIIEMYDRAKAIMSYSVYHYPLIMAGIEDLYQLDETAFRAFAKENGASQRILKGPYAPILRWALNRKLISQKEFSHWEASRELRNMTSHKDSNSIIHPNEGLNTLQNSKVYIESLFTYGPPDFRVQYRKEMDLVKILASLKE